MAKVRGTLGNILIAESTINPGANMTNMRKTMTKNPYDPINFIRIQTKIPQTLNFNSNDLQVYDFAAQARKHQVQNVNTILQMQKRHKQLIQSFSVKNYDPIK